MSPGGVDTDIEMYRHVPLITVCLLLLSACGSTSKVEIHDPNPMEVAEDPASHAGKAVFWGGRILAGRNLERHSELEILAYPLQEDGLPVSDRPPRGRFVAIHNGYLETSSLMPGRLVSVYGSVAGLREERIGDAVRILPEIVIDKLKLWSNADLRHKPRFRFGIGGGNRGVGMGIGISL